MLLIQTGINNFISSISYLFHNSVVGVGGSVSVDVARTGGCSAMCCSGEGLFNTTLKGPGRIILCSMPLEKLRALFPRPARRQKPETAGGDAGP